MLLLIYTAAKEIEEDRAAPPDAVGVVRTQVRLQKLDFWVRYPDYLANELLNEYDQHPDSPGLVDEAERILASREPDLRRFPMLRGRFGAFEQLDNAMSVLVEKGLARKRQRVGEKRVIQHNYYLLDKGCATVDELLIQAPALAWYVERTRTVANLVDGLGGTDIKERQYLQRDYADTPIGSYIPPITAQARQRLAFIRSATMAGAEVTQ
ncbi:hypothetical protein O7627_33585 [Solwaraspora sp. WMMD1047]|uniref:hypothetical protein n=1 Tax=Solwaraspora sp. WMMD1047 TaxID=3016102 RepID=UPI0024172842|nr:hypothetical protein [Solwaraspora sp. WMMD1047]MDG4834199.1 hypothetical protein [Solwaraspora sp. WMMD1047]